MTEALPADWQSTSDTNPAAAIEQAVVANVVGTAVGNALSSQPWLGAALAKVKEQAATLGLKEAKTGPWGEFLQPSGGYRRPDASIRTTMVANAQAYTGNYMSVGAGWCVVSTLFNPFLIFVGAFLYMGSRYANSEREIVIAGRTLSEKEKRAGLLVTTGSVVLLTGALTTMLWIAAFAFMLCVAHAATHAPPEPAAPGVTDIELEPMLPEQDPRIKTQQFSAEQQEVGAEKV